MSKRKLSEIPLIETVEDLLDYRLHPSCNPHDYEKLTSIKRPLKELNSMVGLDSIKSKIVAQIMYYIQGFHGEDGEMMHTVIHGPPGTGKTQLARIMSSIYHQLGIIASPPEEVTKASANTCERCSRKMPSSGCVKSSHSNARPFTIARRSDLIGQYLGQTATKTQEVINRSLGGVLFIDEAYSLGNDSNSDSYSKECIDTLTQNLSEHKRDLMCIIAGYERDLDRCFFDVNSGLRRRFPFVYKLEAYSAKELYDIFKRKLWESDRQTWLMDSVQILPEFFETHRDCFPHNGGDIESFLFHVKIAHSTRVFSMPEKRRLITMDDMRLGLRHFRNSKSVSGVVEDTRIPSMYM